MLCATTQIVVLITSKNIDSICHGRCRRRFHWPQLESPNVADPVNRDGKITIIEWGKETFSQAVGGCVSTQGAAYVNTKVYGSVACTSEVGEVV